MDVNIWLQVVQIAAIVIGGLYALHRVDSRIATTIAVIQNEIEHLWHEMNEVKEILADTQKEARKK
jgi:Tfp pilus assembly protein PilN